MTVNRFGEVCGDNPSLTPDERRTYVGAGFSRIFGVRQSAKASRKQIIGTSCDLPQRVKDAPSPTRIYTEACLSELIPHYCPENAVIIDIGCGPGDHYDWFKKANRSGRYIGIDVKKHSRWRGSPPDAPLSKELVLAQCEDLDMPDMRSNFSMSSSALEHVEDEKAAIARVAAHTEPGAFGLHIVPSSAAFLLYGYHGWRYYSPSTLQKVFESSGYRVVDIVKFGGLPSYLLHFLWIGVLETAMVWRLLLDLLPDNSVTRFLKKSVHQIRYRGARRNKVFKSIYGQLLRISLRLDPYIPIPAHGYAAIVQRI